MAVNSTHPLYDAHIEDWRMMRDAVAGETAVKRQGVKYLPSTPGQNLDGFGTHNSKGQQDYDAYLMRAVFHDFCADAVEYYIGMLHQKPADIELPEGMEDMLDHASADGESLQALLRRIHVEQLTTGRLGLLLDFPTSNAGQEMPWIALYTAETILNWDSSDDHVGVNALNLVVLDESGYQRDIDFTWKNVEQYRVLSLGEVDASYYESIGVQRASDSNVYRQAVYTQKDAGYIDHEGATPPVVKGTPLEQIPFVIINSKDIISSPDRAPLIGLARLSMTIYRGEADYRQSLFMQGQDTLVTIGGLIPTNPMGQELPMTGLDDAVRVGAGARLDLNPGGDAKYIGVNSTGLGEQRQAIEADKSAAENKAGQLIAPGNQNEESGEALSTRLGAQTATLNQIAKSSALGLENILKIAAEWLGKDPDKVKVTPNLEFVDQALMTKDFTDLMSARTMGLPISLESIHQLLVARGATNKTFVEEMALIEDEDMAEVKAEAKRIKELPAGAPGGLPLPAPAPPGNRPANAPAGPQGGA